MSSITQTLQFSAFSTSAIVTLSKKTFVNWRNIIDGITRFSICLSFNWLIKSLPVISPATVTFAPKKLFFNWINSHSKFSILFRFSELL